MTGAQSARVVEQALAEVEAGCRRLGVQAADVLGIAAEDGALDVPRADHVERHHQEPLAGQPAVMAVDRGRRVRECARARTLPASSRFSTAMKWLLPEPNEPCR